MSDKYKEKFNFTAEELIQFLEADLYIIDPRFNALSIMVSRVDDICMDRRFIDFETMSIRIITEPQPYSGDEWKEYYDPLKFEDYGKTWSLDKKDLIKGE